MTEQSNVYPSLKLECEFCKQYFTSQLQLSEHIENTWLDPNHHLCNCGLCRASVYVIYGGNYIRKNAYLTLLGLLKRTLNASYHLWHTF